MRTTRPALGVAQPPVTVSTPTRSEILLSRTKRAFRNQRDRYWKNFKTAGKIAARAGVAALSAPTASYIAGQVIKDAIVDIASGEGPISEAFGEKRIKANDSNSLPTNFVSGAFKPRDRVVVSAGDENDYDIKRINRLNDQINRIKQWAKFTKRPVDINLSDADFSFAKRNKLISFVCSITSYSFWTPT